MCDSHLTWVPVVLKVLTSNKKKTLTLIRVTHPFYGLGLIANLQWSAFRLGLGSLLSVSNDNNKKYGICGNDCLRGQEEMVVDYGSECWN